MNHVCLVSDQPMPNFLPAINPELRPDSVTLVVSARMRDRAAWLRNELSKRQIRVLEDIDIGSRSSDMEAVCDALLNWASNNEELMNNSVLNATGGTKLMTVAAQRVFGIEKRPVFYVDVESDTAVWIDSPARGIKLTNQPTLGEYFGLNGISLESGEFRSEVENEKWRHFCDEIALDPNGWALALGALNAISSDAMEKHEYARNANGRAQALDFRYGNQEKAIPRWADLLEILHADELICWRYGAERFVDAAAAKFCSGTWLEHYVFAALKKMGFDKRRAILNARIVDAKGNRNELDSVVMSGNTCFVIEDKTKNMTVRNGIEGNKADAAVYKLAQLSRTMGLRSKGILVSARAIRPVDKQRAQVYGVTVIDWLPNLDSNLREILGVNN